MKKITNSNDTDVVRELIYSHLLQNSFVPTTKKVSKAKLIENKAKLENRITFIRNEIKYAKGEERLLFLKYLDMLKDQEQQLALLINPELEAQQKEASKTMAKKMQSGCETKFSE